MLTKTIFFIATWALVMGITFKPHFHFHEICEKLGDINQTIDIYPITDMPEYWYEDFIFLVHECFSHLLNLKYEL